MDYSGYENLFKCELKNYSKNPINAFFEQIQCGDYSGLIVFLLFTITLTLFVFVLYRIEGNKNN